MQEDNEGSNITINSVVGQSVGQVLREAREQQGMSVNDVANRIKFAPKQIEWLEADDFVRLPEATFVRGFIRSYARLLNLDPVSLIGSLPSTHVHTPSRQEVKSVDIPLPTGLSAHRHNILWLAAALVVALSLAIFERMHSRSQEKSVVMANGTTVQQLELPAGNAPVDPAQSSVQATEAALDAASRQTVKVESAVVQPVAKPVAAVLPMPQPRQTVEAAKPSVQSLQPPVPKPVKQTVVLPEKQIAPQPVKKVDQKVEKRDVKQAESKPVLKEVKTVPDTVEPQPDEVQPTFLQRLFSKNAESADQDAEAGQINGNESGSVTPSRDVASRAAKTEAGGSEHALRIEFDEDAWLEIKDANDKALISRMHTAGSLVRVTGKAPLLVVVGNSRAVRLFDNGKKINLERYATGDVARIKLK